MRFALMAMVFFGAAVSLPAADDSSWERIGLAAGKQYSGSLAVIRRDGTCTLGKLLRIGPDELTMVPFSSTSAKPTMASVVVPRTEVQLLTNGRRDVQGALFSNRSSWADVLTAGEPPKYGGRPAQHYRVELKSGKVIAGVRLSADDQQLVLRRGLIETAIAKSDIAVVSWEHKVYKQLPSDVEYINLEAPYLVPFMPKAWPYMFDPGLTFWVRLYDASMSEDNSPAACHPGK